MATQEKIIEVKNLSLVFDTYKGVVQALDDVNFSIYKGEFLGIVGETGCGKSVTAKSIVRLIESPPGRITDGEILFDDKDLLKISEEKIRKIRGRDITVIFQDPMTFLNPGMPIGSQISEVILFHQDLAKEASHYRK